MTVPLHDLDAIQADLLAQMAEGPVYVETPSKACAYLDLWEDDSWIDFERIDLVCPSSEDAYLMTSLKVLGFSLSLINEEFLYVDEDTPAGDLFDAIKMSMLIQSLKGF